MSATDDARAEATGAAWNVYLSEHGYATVPTSPDTGADFSAGFEAGAEWWASLPITDERIAAWDAIAQHPFFRECYATEDTLLNAMLAKLSSVTAQLQAAQATIAEALAKISKTPTDGMVGLREILSTTDTSAHDAAILAAKNEGWGEACQALAWCFGNGPERDALPYMIEHNPFRASTEQTEAE